MDVKSLMIGDIVYKTYPKKHVIHWHYDEMFDIFGRPILGRDIEPILLTSEILDKNGFVKHVYGYSFNTLKLCGNLDENDVVWFTISICGEEIKIDYVHQLQHIMRFCGIEKEIIFNYETSN